MSDAGSPHGGEGRRSRNVEGSVPRDIFEVGSQPATPEQFVEELNQVGSTAFPFTVADVPAIREARKGAFDVVNTRSKAMFLEAQVRARIDMFTASAAR